MTGRYDEYLVGVATGLGWTLMMLGYMVARPDLAVSWLVGGGFFVMGGILVVSSIASIIARVKKTPGFPSDTIYEFPSDRGQP